MSWIRCLEIRLWLRVAAVGLALSPVTCWATNFFVAPTQWVRGSDAKSTFEEWDLFSQDPGTNLPNTPGVLVNGSTPDVIQAPFPALATNATVSETSGTSFLTSGNIYSFAAATSFTNSLPNYGAAGATFTTFIVQTQTLGNPIDVNSFVIKDGATTYHAISNALLYTQALGGFGGNQEDRWFEFQVPSNAANYTLQFNASTTSMSLDKLAVDTIWANGPSAVFEASPVPEPSSLILAALGGIGGLLLWWRRHSSSANERTSIAGEATC